MGLFENELKTNRHISAPKVVAILVEFNKEMEQTFGGNAEVASRATFQADLIGCSGTHQDSDPRTLTNSSRELLLKSSSYPCSSTRGEGVNACLGEEGDSGTRGAMCLKEDGSSPCSAIPKEGRCPEGEGGTDFRDQHKNRFRVRGGRGGVGGRGFIRRTENREGGYSSYLPTLDHDSCRRAIQGHPKCKGSRFRETASCEESRKRQEVGEVVVRVSYLVKIIKLELLFL